MLEGHKFDFRIYLLISSVDPIIAFYHDGFCRLSLLKYDTTSNEKSIFFTNTNLAKDIFEHAEKYTNVTGLTEE